MKNIWLSLLLRIVSNLTSGTLINEIKYWVNVFDQDDMPGSEKREHVLKRIAQVAEPYADYLVNLALEAAVAWLRSKQGK